MAEEFRQGHYILGIEGLALLRAGARRSFDGIEARTDEIREVLARLDEPPYSGRRDLPEVDVDTGYARWAEEGYDEPGNDTIAAEEPVVRALLDQLPAGPVLDAACGTGRHAAHLCEQGRGVIGVDASQAMLDRAAAKLPDADLRLGELTALPLADGEVAGAVCALALSHLPELRPAIAELARVLKPGGRLIVSNPHPFATAILGWRAVFVDAGGRRSMIPEYPHLHGDYIAAFDAAGLIVRRCIEPRLSGEQAKARAKKHRIDAFEDALTGVPAVIVWEAERQAVGPLQPLGQRPSEQRTPEDARDIYGENGTDYS
jgi:SAM-dependent methyltransferase